MILRINKYGKWWVSFHIYRGCFLVFEWHKEGRWYWGRPIRAKHKFRTVLWKLEIEWSNFTK